MFLKVYNTNGEYQRHLNLDRVDAFRKLNPVSDVLIAYQFYHGGKAVEYCISERQERDLNRWLAENHIV